MSKNFEDIYFFDENGKKNYRIVINGCWNCLATGDKFEVTNPATGEFIAYLPNCSEIDVENAIKSAKEYKEWKKYTPVQRLEIMEKAGKLLEENIDTLAKIITEESGKPISVSIGEVKATAERLRLTQQEVRVLYGEYIPGEWVEDTQNKFAIVLRKPLGVVAAISSFNYPLYIAAAKIIPAILAGNTVVAKPSSETPISLIYFVKILEMAGMPEGAVNIITGRGKIIGDKLVSHEDIAAVTFTGSTNVGAHISKLAGMKKLHLELGGKASAIVLEDADLDNAAIHICKGTFRNSGQRCDAVSRVLVQKSVSDKLIEKILKESEKYPIGNPMDMKTGVGTVINEAAIKRIDSLVKDAVEKGAEILTGGKYSGLFYEPTILKGVTVDMRIAWEEIFGPVMPIIEVESADMALEISNKSEFGLDSCIFTENINMALKISREMEDGTVSINASPAHGVGHFPFGGNKLSGMGREGLKYSIDELTKLHTIIVNEK